MSAPNLFLFYVTDIERSTRFYCDLFEIEPVFRHPSYIAFETGTGTLFSLWNSRGEAVARETPRSSELGLMVTGGDEAVDELYAKWSAKDLLVVEEIHDEIFGRTFVIADPDGNLIRVCLAD
ncbi:VOC family protein [Agromyces laixinhei]|uniref:VOC family protein n=1 Tax=Agromyces laixinhei TaxID=2585717 RepID=UPI001116EF77|nr:VOC family protein [Agromyces laixinhei]